MCTVVNSCGCNQPAPVAPTVVAGILWGAVKLAWRWLSGAPMRGRRTTGATFLHGAPPPGPVSWRHPRWACWPGWHRAILRCAVTALAVTAWQWPLATAVTVALAMLAITAAAVTVRRRTRARTRPIRVGTLAGERRRAVDAGPQLRVDFGQPAREEARR